MIKVVCVEKIKENYKQKVSQNSQMMLISEVINLTHKEMEFVKNNMEMLINTGFDIELFGKNSVKIEVVEVKEYNLSDISKNIDNEGENILEKNY